MSLAAVSHVECTHLVMAFLVTFLKHSGLNFVNCMLTGRPTSFAMATHLSRKTSAAPLFFFLLKQKRFNKILY